MLPLGYWDSLYYALVAEIRQLHGDLQSRYGFGCESATEPLHMNGLEGDSNLPVTAVDLASMLETAWYTLMDHRLVATLDGAVQMRRLREQSAQADIDNATTQFISSIKKKNNGNAGEGPSTDPYERPPIIYGLMDVNALTPEAIINLLWEKYAPEINQACCEDFEDDSMLTAYRAEIYKMNVEQIMEASTPLPSANMCRCHRTCLCKLKCDGETGKCTCQNLRADIYDLVYLQEAVKGKVYKYVKRDQHAPYEFLGAPTNTQAQMQVAALANPAPTIVQACRNISQANQVRDSQSAGKNRERSGTNDSDLAYVPEAKARYHVPKDVYPLDFYGRNSGQRYPKLPPQPLREMPSNVSGSSFYRTDTPRRKPVPPPIMPSANPHSHHQYSWQVPTPPMSIPHEVLPYTHHGPVTYPAIPTSQSQSMFTQSCPTSNTGNPRENEDSRTAMPASYTDHAQDYIGILPRHPSTIEQYEDIPEAFRAHSRRPPMSKQSKEVPEPFPAAPRPTTCSSPEKTKAATTTTLPTLKTFNNFDTLKEKPHPPLPTPDFIHPRPATKQRYVSAGGNAKLQDRAEIKGPVMNVSIADPTATSILKEEVDAKMSDPHWVRYNFGEHALGRTGTISPPRRSDESSKRNSQRNSGKKSDESVRSQDKDGEKRDRTSSGAGRVAKLKRVFSRKNSQSETD